MTEDKLTRREFSKTAGSVVAFAGLDDDGDGDVIDDILKSIGIGDENKNQQTDGISLKYAGSTLTPDLQTLTIASGLEAKTVEEGSVEVTKTPEPVENPSLTHTQYAKNLTNSQILNGTWIPDARNPVFDTTDYTNRDVSTGHILGAPSAVRFGDKITVWGEQYSKQYSGERIAYGTMDLRGEEIYGPQIERPNIANTAESWSSRGDGANPVPLYIPEKNKGYLLYSSFDGSSTWSMGLAATDDFQSFTAIDSVNPIYTGRAHGDLVRHGDTIYCFPAEKTLTYIKTSVSDFPSGWSSPIQTDFSRSSELRGKILRTADGWIWFYVDGGWNGSAIRAAYCSSSEFPDTWHDHGEIIPAGGAGAWNEGGFRNPCPVAVDGSVFLLTPGVPSGGATSDSQTGIYRLNQHRMPVVQPVPVPERLNFDGDQTTTSTSWSTLAKTRIGIQEPIDKLWVRARIALSNSGSYTTEYRLRNTDDSATILSLSNSGTSVSVEDSGWRGPVDASYGVQGDRIAVQMKVSGGTGTLDARYTPGVQMKASPGRTTR